MRANRRASGVTWRSVLASVAGLLLAGTSLAAVPDWPPATAETRPWTRFWWMGSSVDAAGLRAALEAYQQVGLGGVEITPIYGVRGFEDRFVPYLSPQWVERLETALAEARRLGLGVDMATGTGWPFGGPWVGADDACKTIAHETYRVNGGERLAEAVRFRQKPLLRAVGDPIDIGRLVEPVEANPNLQALALDQVRFPRDLPLHVLMAYSDRGEVVDLTARVGGDGRLDWTAPPGTWTLHALFLGDHGKLVERAAPGGEGNVIDHFAAAAIRSYLRRFDEAFAGRPLDGLRAFFNDSYEVDDAAGQSDWTPLLFDEFQKRRGYDLRRELPALFATDGSERSARVLVDYRETLSDLLLDGFTTEWRSWAGRRGKLVRNQAHGSPASILDLYAASDIPETEGLGLYRVKWASSAANVTGKRLVAAEAATWLGEHFVSTLADVRAAVDRYFVGGVNHVVYHGTAYSPPGEPWPGWLFYASVHFQPSNTWWSDLAALNRYVTRVQSFLQSGRPDNDVLLYFPFHDALAVRGPGLLRHFGDERRDLPGTPFDAAFDTLQGRGFGFDFVSDRLLRGVKVKDGGLQTNGGDYRALVLPAARFVPLETFAHALDLARAGATVIAYRGLPAGRARAPRPRAAARAPPPARGAAGVRRAGRPGREAGAARPRGGPDRRRPRGAPRGGGGRARAAGRSRPRVRAAASRGRAVLLRVEPRVRSRCRAGCTWRRTRAPWPSTTRCAGAAGGRGCARPVGAGPRCTCSSRPESRWCWRPTAGARAAKPTPMSSPRARRRPSRARGRCASSEAGPSCRRRSRRPPSAPGRASRPRARRRSRARRPTRSSSRGRRPRRRRGGSTWGRSATARACG